jgi:hypothetical protein
LLLKPETALQLNPETALPQMSASHAAFLPSGSRMLQMPLTQKKLPMVATGYTSDIKLHMGAAGHSG